MTKRTWKRIGNLADKENYVYRSEGGYVVEFKAHPTQSFSWIISQGNESVAETVIEAFMVAGFMQHSFKGGFAEAVQTLTVGG